MNVVPLKGDCLAWGAVALKGARIQWTAFFFQYYQTRYGKVTGRPKSTIIGLQ